MEEEKVIRDIDHVVSLARHGTIWFRGHSRTFGDLQPKIYRPEYSKVHEITIYNKFKSSAPAFYDNCPEVDDEARWMFLMQHHGLPTRLLDWTKSILIALMFCVKDEVDWDKDGELCILDTTVLSRKSNFEGVPIIHTNSLCKYHFNEWVYEDMVAIERYSKIFKLVNRGFKIRSTPVDPLPIEPIIGFQRMQNQQSVFTIHPIKSKGMKWFADENIAKCYKVPKGIKIELHNQLTGLGVSESTLFPSLDGLSQSLIMLFKLSKSSDNWEKQRDAILENINGELGKVPDEIFNKYKNLDEFTDELRKKQTTPDLLNGQGV